MVQLFGSFAITYLVPDQESDIASAYDTKSILLLKRKHKNFLVGILKLYEKNIHQKHKLT